jgi:hypothetical protein
MLLMFVRYFFSFIISNFHPFHVSVCEVYHNPSANSLEISLKIFIDDLELAIQKQGNENFRLISSNDKGQNNNQLKNYITAQFKIKIDSKAVDLSLVGYEFEDDAILCYFEGKKTKEIREIEIQNSIITEVYDDQINLTHFQYKDEMKSLKTSKENISGIIDTSGW